MLRPILPDEAWQALEEAFAWADRQSSEVQQQFLEELRENRPELVSDLEAMLSGTHCAERFEDPDFEQDLIEDLGHKTSRVGEEFGPYRILEVLASGGMVKR
ncbi:MAG: hypothetical protein O3A95_09695 [Planctomycetota bacterium]|nr:hypothetical protein [Planctomycetota bacterium]MDA1114554.1 hypothetical protein [Planctomycetota bacterium]